MWTLSEGIRLVRMLQPRCRDYGYHLTIGGGVVNNGRSNKDLDLYFLPMGGFDLAKDKNDPNGLLKYLESKWGKSIPLGQDDYPGGAIRLYVEAVKFVGKNARIDCFIL